MSTNRKTSETPTIAELLDSDIQMDALALQIRRTEAHLLALKALHAYLCRQGQSAPPIATFAHNGSNAVLRVPPNCAQTTLPGGDTGSTGLRVPPYDTPAMEWQRPTPVKPIVPIRRQSTGDELQAAADRVSAYLAANPAGATYNEIRSACRVSPAMFAAVISQVAGVIVRNPVTKIYTYVPPSKPPVEPIP